MGRRTTRGRKRQPQGPSKFFIAALGIGLLLLLIVFVTMLGRPQQPAPPAVPPASSTSR